jgi:cysteine-rich repeat protein
LIVIAVCTLMQAASVLGAACGNGAVEAGEACDDGNLVPGDCCSPACATEETRSCLVCGDGIDNDGNGRMDAEDPGCATLAQYQRAAVVETDPVPAAGDKPAVDGVLLPGGLVGDAVDGRCDASRRECVCPEQSSCQARARPCVADADCLAVPYPLGRSRAGVCAGGDPRNDPAVGCRPHDELARMARAIDRIPASGLPPIAVTPAQSPWPLSFGGGRHVIDVESVELDAGAELVLLGEADTTLVLRVRGECTLGASAAVVLGGQLAPDRVLWVFAGDEGSVALGDGARFAGTLLAPERAAVELGQGVQIHGAILARQVAAGRVGRR